MSKKEKAKKVLPENFSQNIIIKPVGWLKNYDRNSRTHSKTQVKQIAASMLEFGFTMPIYARADGTIIAGHGRLLGAIENGFTDVPVIIADHLTEDQARAYVIADNKLTDESQFDEKILAEELLDLDALGYDILKTGFDQLEVDDLLADYINDDSDDEDEPPPPKPSKAAPVVSGPGDIWVLGRHRLLCGSSNKQENIETLVQGESPDLVVISTPIEEVNNIDVKGLQKTYKDAALFLFLANHFKGLPAGNEYIVWDKTRKGGDFSDVQLAWSNVPGGICSKYTGPLETDEDAPEIEDQKPAEFYEKLYRRYPNKPPVLELFAGLGGGLVAAEARKKTYRGIELDPAAVDYAVMKWQEFTGQKAILENTGETFGSLYGKRVNG